MELEAIVRAAKAFLAAMHREHLKRYPGTISKVPALEDLTDADRRSLLMAIGTAVSEAKKKQTNF